MKGAGFGMIAAGGALFAFAMFMSVAAPGGEFGDIANADLMNQRLMFAVIGGALFVSGWLALILDRLAVPAAKAAKGDQAVLSEQY